MKKIIVAGSMNMDMVVKTSHIPRPGETVLGGSFFMNPGGKGANQAIAVARLGGDVAFIGKMGDDIFGKQSAQLFEEEGVNTQGIVSDAALPSGIALITVDQKGENSIVVAPGANANLKATDVEKALTYYPDAALLLIQLEIPMDTVAYTAKRAKEKGMKIILNPAPANELPKEVFELMDIITPNESEAEMLSGIRIADLDSAGQAARKIQAKGPKQVIITMGKQGAAVLEDDAFFHVPAPSVETIDTTAAGDVFNGALAVAIAEGKPLREATNFACRAAAIAVTRLGAQSSIPYRNEVLMSIIS
ncbi:MULTISPECIES: ribokinase [Olivibacter]|jgi:ribokinase|uniref:Ribokinase n=1 Tax=Olivibacter oleidegradans TaxID=760123 RepID=A0ABV6HPS9_9SPHI|nr:MULTISPECIES: ribokinase [Olivibacter]MCL4641911.1 ribokinase [Olivibacter sp. UJ_SKK_5.1]MDM8173067.1 ribokinase [Olivibacter sp. 47]MDX3915506.1 ribokinase [Pseudosphingobacterium sp.]QEL02852.1 ribokinase [Olivibacter sp. LS-1]